MRHHFDVNALPSRDVTADQRTRDLEESLGALWLHGQALVDLAEVRQLTGHPKQAAELLDQARSVWEQKGNLAARLDGRAKVA